MQTVELVGRLLISLAVVIGLIWLVARKMRGGRRRAMRTDRLIDVLGRQNLSRSSSLAVVRVADRAMIVGVTDSSVRMIGEIELDAVQAKLAEMDPATRLGGGIPRQRSRGRSAASSAFGAGSEFDSAYDAVRGSSDIAGADADLAMDFTGDRVPASPAELAGMLTAADLADIAEIRARRAETGGGRGKPARESGPLTGSALSPATWRQTLDALRDLTARKG